MTHPADVLVSTKLRPSQARARLVARPRLVASLTREPGRRLTLLSAPAGFGKTTLLNEWASSRAGGERYVAWLSLDEGDNDPARFLSYLIAALGRTTEEGFGNGILAALHAPQPPRLEALAGALINEFADLPGEVSLILDDYHLIAAEAVHRIVSFLLEHSPPNLHLVISGRVDPPLPLSRLRARGQMAELGAAELAFTRQEADAFLSGVMSLDLSERDIATLEARTEGWIAGLQLAALSMQGREDRSGFIASFSGGHRDVLDFLTEEVLERQPEDVRGFLLETSMLDGLTGSLCDALTGRNDGSTMLERLEQENLFVVTLDDERCWYRYHHLFRDFLRSRLKRERSARRRDLHLRASAWYEENGYLAEAIEHALSAHDHDRAMRLIGREARRAWSRGEVPTVLRWLETLPAEVKRLQPGLLSQQALALALTGRPDDVEPLLQEIDRVAGDARAGGTEQQFLSGFTAAIRAWCARLRGDAPRAIALARRALSLLPDEQGGLRAFAAVCLGDALWTTGDLSTADEALADAVRVGRSAGHVYSTLSAMTLLARVQTERGRLHEASETLREAQRYVTEQRVELLPAVGAIHIGMGALQYERNDLEEAERALKAGIELAKLTGNVTDLVWGFVILSRTKRARRDEEGALEAAHEAERVARDYGADLEIAIARAWMTRLCLAQGNVTDVAGFEREWRPEAVGAAAAARMIERITSARHLHARGRHQAALRLLDELRESAEANGRTRDLIEIRSLQAMVQWTLNDRVCAVSSLADALALAAPEGYVRTFVDEGQPMADILSRALETRHGIRRDAPPRVPTRYVKKLLAALEREIGGPLSSVLPESLTQREFEILKLIAAGKSNRLIAGELFVTVGTIKTHLNNLYRKLDAHSRTQALARARELGLL